ncbi:MAG: site-2 protease family protein [Pirellulaceae bacterium]
MSTSPPLQPDHSVQGPFDPAELPENAAPQAEEGSSEVELPERLTLCDSLTLHREQGNANTPHDLLEDSAKNRFFRLGPGEGNFVEAIRSGCSVREAIQRDDGNGGLNEVQVATFIRWMTQCGIIESNTPPPAAAQGLIGQLLFYRLTLGNPDVYLTRINQVVGWAFSLPALVIGLVLACLSFVSIWTQRTEFMLSYENLVSPWRGMWLLFAWVVLKTIHELGHGVTCKRYGGGVPKYGLAFICMVPIAFVDVTSSWLFKSHWKRLHVSLAGVSMELIVAALAVLVWNLSESLLVKNAAADIVLLASVTTILFNLNPLLRFDGYFALADTVDVVNLYQHGQSYSRYFGMRYILGVDRDPPELPEKHAFWIKPYGIAAAFWRVVTMFGILTGAAAMFAGFGIAIALAGLVSFIAVPLGKLVGSLWKIQQESGLAVGKLSIRLGVLVCLIAGLLFTLPAELERTAPGIVEFNPPSILRAPANGFLVEVYVEDGERVEVGQPVAKIRNEDLQLEMLELRTQLQSMRNRVRTARWENELSEVDEGLAELNALEAQLQELQFKINSLLICAPHSGRLVARNFSQRLGTHLEEGDEIAAIGDEQRKRLKVSIGSWDAARIEAWDDRPLRVRVTGLPTWHEHLTRIETRASEVPPDPTLTAANGGTLPVMHKQGQDDPVLTSPRVNAFFELSAERSQALTCGQRCFVGLTGRRQSIAEYLQSSVAKAIW